MKKKVLSGVLVAVAAALVGIQSATTVAAEAASQTWTVYVHFEYENGFNYDYPIARGIPTSEVAPILRDCGAAHRLPSVVRHYCFPVAD